MGEHCAEVVSELLLRVWPSARFAALYIHVYIFILRNRPSIPRQ